MVLACGFFGAWECCMLWHVFACVFLIPCLYVFSFRVYMLHVFLISCRFVWTCWFAKISKVFGAFFHFCMVDVIGCYIWKAQGLLFVSATVSFAYAVTQLNHNLILHGRTLLKSCDMCDYFLQTLCKQAFYKLERNLVCLYMPNMRV